MPAEGALPIARSGRTFLYGVWRGLVRLWFALSFRKLRVLHAESFATSGPALLLVSHPGSFLDALILVAAFDRPVRCLMERELIGGPLRRLLARGLGMILYDPEVESWRAALEVCCAVLGRKDAVVVFADQSDTRRAAPGGLALTAATIGIEAESRHAGQLGLAAFPVHLFLPVERSQSSELLIHVDPPEIPQQRLSRMSGNLREQIRDLGEALERRCRENAFRLHDPDLKRFLSDLEEVLRSELEEDWASRSAWKQKTEGFALSGFVAGWAEQANFLNPGRLVALRESLDAWREARRRWSLRQFRVEGAGAWLSSAPRRALVWLESAVGFVVALYGFINHLPTLLLLHWLGLLPKHEAPKRAVDWLLRALLTLGCYAGQTLLVAHFLGRPSAAYYAPSLPVAGLYLWRYVWLLRNRTHPAFLALTLPSQAAKVRRIRKEFIEEFNAVLALHAEAAGLAR